MKRLPIGIQTFAKMVKDDHYYVDKTKLIPKLTEIGTYFFLSRPRRFGKSLFLDTIKEAFEGNEKLFKGLFLEKKWNWSKKYPVIKISFGGGQTQNAEELKDAIQDMFLAFEKYFSVTLESKSIQGKFKELIISLYHQVNQKVVIVIDEYDKPILDVIDKTEIALNVRDELKNLYSVIKDSDAYIQFVFITGVSKFSKVNLFSGLNNLIDLTLDQRFATICGYTQQEMLTVFQDRLDGVPLDLLKEWYNGYNFLGEKVYNPFDILLYFDNKKFKNYWFSTGTPSFLIKLVNERKFNIPDIENIQLSEDSMDSFDVDSIELETLLFQTGYLTIKDVYQFGQKNAYHLQYPNLEVKASLTDFILHSLSKNNQSKEKNQEKLFTLLLNNDLDKLKDLFHSFFASIPYEWYTNNTLSNYEGYYASIFYCYFTALGLEVKVEDSTNHGKIDMAVFLKNRCYIFEFKVNELTSTGKAMAQLKEKKYHEKYIGYESAHIDSGTVAEIYLIGVEFSKTDRNITEFGWEKVL